MDLETCVTIGYLFKKITILPLFGFFFQPSLEFKLLELSVYFFSLSWRRKIGL